MPQITYSTADLLSLRPPRPSTAPLDKVSLEKELFGVLRRRVSCVPTYSMKLSTASSSDSDEKLPYKGLEGQLGAFDSTDGHDQAKVVPAVISREPIAPPPDLRVQKDEGFRRFYKAVVSPTHVRVTAGGRIVPNTRGPQSPSGKWNAEKDTIDESNAVSAQKKNLGNAPALIFGQPPFGAMPAFYPAVAPGVTQVPSPFVPLPMGFGLPTGMSMPSPGIPNSHPLDPSALEQGIGNAKNGGKPGDVTDGAKPGSMRASSSESIDPTRAYLYNGQFVVPTHPAFFPMGVMGPPIFPAARYHGQVLAASNVSVSPMMGPLQYHHGPAYPPHQSPISVCPGAPQQSSTTYQPPGAPPRSSIRMSDITKKHLENLRSSLKKCEDQLQYNKHQIDEKQMEQHAQLIRINIQQFEAKLQVELAHEKALYPKAENIETSSNVGPACNGASSSSSTSDESRLGAPLHTPRVCHKKMPPNSQMPLRDTSGVNSTRATPSIFALPGPILDASQGNEPVKRAGALPSSAALAPPFQPRRESVALQLNSGLVEKKPCFTQTQVEAEKSRLMQAGRAERLAKEQNDLQCYGNGSNRCLPAIGTREQGGIMEAPYLVGTLAQGADPKTAKESDYTYRRPLTEDEIRARYLYWGKAPASVMKGLPKFDGKDFYPPSPEKRAFTQSSQDEPFRSIPPTGSPATDFGAEQPQRVDPFVGVQSSKTAPAGAFGIKLELQQEPVSNINQNHKPRAATDEVTARTTPLETLSGFRSSLDDSDDEHLMKWMGRRGLDRSSTRSHNELWQNMLKKANASANVLPGAVTSMTAHGYLPAYSGHAVPSLSPAIATSPISQTRVSQGKAVMDGRGAAAGAVTTTVDEVMEPPHKISLR